MIVEQFFAYYYQDLLSLEKYCIVALFQMIMVGTKEAKMKGSVRREKVKSKREKEN